MAITKQKKEEVVAKVEDIAKKSSTIVFAHFKKLGVAEQNEMRKALRAQNVGLTVAKKTLLNLGLSKAKVGGTEPALDGEIVIAYAPFEASAKESILHLVSESFSAIISNIARAEFLNNPFKSLAFTLIQISAVCSRIS